MDESKFDFVFQNCRVREILANTTKRGYIDIFEHLELKQILLDALDAGVMNELTSFEDVQTNSSFGGGIVDLLCAGLPQTIKDSIYFSDFDFMNRCKTEKEFDEYLDLHGIDIPNDVKDSLFKKNDLI